MIEIKSVNTIYNSNVLIECSGQLNPEDQTFGADEYAAAFFHPENKPGEWIVDIKYESLETPDCGQDMNCGKIVGIITFINSKDENEKIEFNFDDTSAIYHYISTYDTPADNIHLTIDLMGTKTTITLDILYDKLQNAIVGDMVIDTSINQIADNKHFIDYSHLKLDPSLILGAILPQDIEIIKNNIDKCNVDIFFVTDYYYNNLSDFNPWHV
jgi:hypothetical protein